MSFEEMKQGLWPQKGGKLIKEIDNYYNFAHFGWGDPPTQTKTMNKIQASPPAPPHIFIPFF
jgi:hypothetical protein